MKIRPEIRESHSGFFRAFLVNTETNKSMFQTSRRYKTEGAAQLDVSRLKMALARNSYISRLVSWAITVGVILWVLSS